MAGSVRMGWQKESLALRAGVLAVTVLLTVVATLLMPLLDRLPILGVPAGFLVLSMMVPLALAAIGFWFLFHRAAIDRKYLRTED